MLNSRGHHKTEKETQIKDETMPKARIFLCCCCWLLNAFLFHLAERAEQLVTFEACPCAASNPQIYHNSITEYAYITSK